MFLIPAFSYISCLIKTCLVLFANHHSCFTSSLEFFCICIQSSPILVLFLDLSNLAYSLKFFIFYFVSAALLVDFRSGVNVFILNCLILHGMPKRVWVVSQLQLLEQRIAVQQGKFRFVRGSKQIFIFGATFSQANI